jgi:uncharacterized protein YdaT
MINSILKPAQTASVDQSTGSEAPKSRASRSINATKEADTTKLHAKETPAPKFKKINASDKGLEKEVQAILKRYKVDSDKYHGAALSTDGKSLVISHDGKTTLKENFGGTSSLGRFASKIFKLFSGVDRSIAAPKYKEFFNNYKPDNKDVGMVMEPISHLFKGLSTNHYHGVSIFHKDEKTGKFNKTPSAVSIIDSYKFIFEEHEKGNEMPDAVKAKKALFDNAYALDKTIPIDMEKAKDFRKIYNEIAEGLYQAQGFSFITIPGQVHKTLNANTSELNYVEMPWHRVQQSADNQWRVQANKKEFDSEMLDPKDQKFYESRMIDSEHTNITIVRPLDQAQEPLEPFIGYMENWSQMYSGNTLRANDKDNQKLVDLAQSVSSKYIETYNAEFLNQNA